MEKVFYTHTDAHENAVVTVCLMRKYKSYSRGIAILSKLDHPNEERGVAKAEGRATKALKRKQSCLPINRDEAIRLLFETNAPPFKFKADYQIELTNHEKNLVQ